MGNYAEERLLNESFNFYKNELLKLGWSIKINTDIKFVNTMARRHFERPRIPLFEPLLNRDILNFFSVSIVENSNVIASISHKTIVLNNLIQHLPAKLLSQNFNKRVPIVFDFQDNTVTDKYPSPIQRLSIFGDHWIKKEYQGASLNKIMLLISRIHLLKVYPQTSHMVTITRSKLKNIAMRKGGFKDFSHIRLTYLNKITVPSIIFILDRDGLLNYISNNYEKDKSQL